MAVPLVREAPFPLVLGETEIGSIGVIVDSGASQSVVLAGLARELGIATTEGTIPVGVAAGTGQVQARMGILPVLNIGTLEIRNLPVLVVEAAALEQSGVGVILAPQRALSGFYVTLDFGLQEMRVSSDAEQPYDGRGINSIELPYVFVGFDIAIEAAVGKGGWALFGVDTGMSSSYVVNTAYNNSATVRQAQIAGLGVHEQGVGVLEAVPVSIGNMAILPDEHGWQSPGMLTPDCVQLSGLLGNGLWRDGVVTFDTRAQKLRLLLPKR